VRLGLVGYGVGGRYFHAPFVAAANDVGLTGVVTRGDGDVPVPAEQAVHTLEVLDAARTSAAENRVVDLS
jgi:predicted dehydrogenase